MARMVIPRCRQELVLYPAEADLDGAPAWVLHDPLSNRHFRLGALEVDLLAWLNQGQDIETIAQLASLKLGTSITIKQVEELLTFLRNQHLVIADSIQIQTYQKQQQFIQAQQSIIKQLIKHYLFFRLPLWKVDDFLTQTLKYVTWLSALPIRIGLIILLIMALFLTSRHWDEFSHTFLHFFNPQGFIGYAIALASVKIFHELGHAYTAKKMGCTVPIIGIAFMVGWPVLYTDTSDAWKLNSAKKRLAINFAGVAVELSIAILSLLIWNMTEEGLIHSLSFLLATSTWINSLLINGNPLMRFDGYYLLADYLRIPNLDSRATTLGRWYLREKLFNFGFEPPEPLRYRLLIFAYSVWLYRFILYLSIAALVYYFFFKVLGIILFAIEVIYFLIRPFYNEAKMWIKLLPFMRWNLATIRSLSVLILLLSLGFMPWYSSITAPAYLKAHYIPIYTPVAAQIKSIKVHNFDSVMSGQILIELTSPELNYEFKQLQQRYNDLSWQRSTLGFAPELRKQALIVNSELLTQKQRLSDLQQQLKQLKITANESATVIDMNPDIRVGDWIATATPLLALIKFKQSIIIGYVAEDSLNRIKIGEAARFYPEKGYFAPISAKVIHIEPLAIRNVETLYPASLFGGDLAVRQSKTEELIPVTSTYRIQLQLLEQPPLFQRVMRGNVVIQGEKTSFYQRVKRQLIQLFRRESGF